MGTRHTGVPTDVVSADQATVSGRVGWTGEAIAIGYRESCVPDGRCAGIDMVRVAGSNIDTASQTPSVWAGVELAKLYTGVGPSDLDAGIAGISQPAYLGQPIQLQPATPTQLASGQIRHPLVIDPGAGTAPVLNWNRSVELWVRAPQGHPTGAPPNASAQGWEVGFMPEASPHNAAIIWTTGSKSIQPVNDPAAVSTSGDVDSCGGTRSSSNAETPALRWNG